MIRLSAVLALATALMLGSPTTAATPTFPPGYRAHHTFPELRQALQDLAAAHPGIANLRTMGRSYEGRKMFVVKISDNVAVNENEPEVYIDGGIHAHEHLSTEQSLALVEWLLGGYGSDARTTSIVDSTEIWIAPLVNPDGATHDVSGGVFHQWRKNRQPNPESATFGTDINRNFGYKWGGGGSSADPSNAFYRGPRAWSTVEARNIRRFILSRVLDGKQQIRLALTIHSHGEFVMYPFGWTSNPEPADMRAADAAAMKALAEGVAVRNDYRAVQAGQLYRSSGTFMDWAYARQRIFALTLEMSPRADVDNGWYVRDEDMLTLLTRNHDALLWFLEQAG